MYISKLVVDRLRQMRGTSPFDHIKDHFVPNEIRKRRKSKRLLPVTIDRTQLKSFISNMLSWKPISGRSHVI